MGISNGRIIREDHSAKYIRLLVGDPSGGAGGIVQCMEMLQYRGKCTPERE
jgi:hypothetical protein